MVMKTYRRVMWLGVFMLATAGWFGANPGTASAAGGVCADDGGTLPKECTKEIRVYNNTARKIWVVLQASIQLTDAISCPRGEPGTGGDVWLQAALGNYDDCLAVKSNYYAFVNGPAGIGKDGFASIDVPWWSKRQVSAKGDRYIDWWRGARVIIFDDRTAFNEIYNALKNNPTVPLVAGSPKPGCDSGMKNNECTDVSIFEVTPEAEIAPHLPFQLNEFTFADVCRALPNGTFILPCGDDHPGGFIDFNQNYNVSNVDQVYLPLAMEPVRKPANVGYMGSTMTVKKFRNKLTKFTNADKKPNNPDWPIYNNPEKKNGKKFYPNAGIRVPSAQSVLAYYMNPTNFPDGSTPTIIPKKRPDFTNDMISQWNDCTSANPDSCKKSQAELYKSVDVVFEANYKKYIDTCPADRVPDFLKPVGNGKQPKITTYLTFIYGWVPFNVSCGNEELPVASTPPPASRALLNYFEMQYNFEALNKQANWFNPYTHLVHADAKDGGLEASAYAFSIDDHASFLSNNGGTTPGGLIFAVGGPEGLANGKQHAPPVPSVYRWYDFSVGLGAPDKNGPYWKKYGICSEKADTPFPTEEKGGFVFGIDPARTKINANNPCPITLMDTAGRKYQFIIKSAQAPGSTLPQKPIWPAYTPPPGLQYNPDVLECPTKSGFVPPDEWCGYTVQLANANPNALTNPLRQFEIAVRSPLPK